ncbi:hypothetical protein LY78DRAFT_681557 [Colletotrichum sublineola]|nr:hypothetical protein LY78DRAFT_681557 [Colletotrichum sublineola]
MRITLPTVALIAAVCVPQVVRTNFNVFEAEADCDEAVYSPVWEDHGDVSGSKMGVCCKGSGCAPQNPANAIDELKMHFSNNPLHLQEPRPLHDGTKSKNLVDGNAYRNCIVFPNGDYNCPFGGVRIEGRRKFRCLTRYTANDLRANVRLAEGSTTLSEFAEARTNRDMTAVPLTV